MNMMDTGETKARYSLGGMKVSRMVSRIGPSQRQMAEIFGKRRAGQEDEEEREFGQDFTRKEPTRRQLAEIFGRAGQEDEEEEGEFGLDYRRGKDGLTRRQQAILGLFRTGEIRDAKEMIDSREVEEEEIGMKEEEIVEKLEEKEEEADEEEKRRRRMRRQ